VPKKNYHPDKKVTTSERSREPALSEVECGSAVLSTSKVMPARNAKANATKLTCVTFLYRTPGLAGRVRPTRSTISRLKPCSAGTCVGVLESSRILWIFRSDSI
jgi:hypothetical protein